MFKNCTSQNNLICNKMNAEKGEEVAPRCRLSDPAHPHTLCRRDNPRPSLCFRCGPVNENDEDYDWNNIHYYC